MVVNFLLVLLSTRQPRLAEKPERQFRSRIARVGDVEEVDEFLLDDWIEIAAILLVRDRWLSRRCLGKGEA